MNLLGLPDPAPTVQRMAELGVLAVILPEADPDALRRLAALLPAQVPLAEQVAARFRLSGAQKKRLATAAAREDVPGDGRALAYRLGRDAALDRLLLAGADVAA